MKIRFIATFLLLVSIPATTQVFGQLRSRPAEEWIERLDREERVRNLEIPEVIERLRLQPGLVVADIGAGAGAFALPFARAVAPSGTVYAVEVDPGFITHLAERAREEGISTLEPVLGEFTDPKIPAKVELAFFHDVLHHIEHRPEYLKTLANYIRPDGRVAIIDMIPDHPESPHRDSPELQVWEKDVIDWMSAAGFVLSEKHFVYDHKYFLVFQRTGSE